MEKAQAFLKDVSLESSLVGDAKVLHPRRNIAAKRKFPHSVVYD